ncbi:uncharacterized protein DUF3710 [Nocardiopsis sp. Huas11]|uniref:DUF3710 domain-containing protein n=1 Tax=Nocardiopsis sp. Huas11 TaxID=2183912 RepID=UPI000EACE0BE|nr:DUF3710 domain-containing protein [Nocardiopsis sp. Huas11]RKS07877.1 uncharacterized protein DUF3710 [Nocardiopsis sp. Huas11]
MFGRRRKKRDQETDRTAKEAPRSRRGAAGAVSFDNEIEPERPTSQSPKAADRHRANGPWDSHEDFPELQRMDMGSLRLPVQQGSQIQLNFTKDAQGKQRVIGVTLVLGKTWLQVRPFAAPKTSGLWDERRAEILEQVTKEGGRVQEHEGTFGTEIKALLPVKGRTTEDGKQVAEPVRFIGVDGPRWLLHGVIRGEGAIRPEKMGEVEQIFAGIVVVRGDQPVPPGDMLQIVVPKKVQEQMAEAAKAKAAERAAGGGTGGSVNGDAPGGAAGGPTQA